LSASVESALVLWQVLDWPILACFFFMPVVVAMSYEMSRDVLRAAQLSRDLRESEQRMTLATDATNVGIWIRDLVRNEIWATDKWRALIGFTKSERIDLDSYLQKLHPEDREAVRQILVKAVVSDDHYETEYRVVLPEGRIRWIASRGRIERNSAKKPVLVRGASFDITERRQAEAAARDLGGRLINAQEDERRRIARELHDDLNQRLALVSVELEMFGQNPPSQIETITSRMQDFSGQVKSMASEVHRLAHELHPAKLEQLGLAATIRGFCRELATAHEIAIEFVPRNVPPSLPDDLALCLYRITQESLQNVIKHSGATNAKVELTAGVGELLLTVTDDGCGFDPQTVATSPSLGIIGMRERVRMLHGQISVQSSPDKGTRIEVRVSLKS
jgi:PAS domain S-box-containing protein